MLKTINNGKTPVRATEFSAAVDLFANEDAVIKRGETKIVGLGVVIDMEYIKDMFIEDDRFSATDIAKRLYADDYKAWLDNLKIGEDDSFEFETYNDCPMYAVEESDIEIDEYDLEYYKIVFNGKRMKEFLSSYYLDLKPRSGLRAKGIIADSGVIDLDYPKEIKIILNNFSFKKEGVLGIEDTDFTIKKGDKIAQIMLKKHETDLMGFFSDKQRTSGFGSTGNR